MPKSILIADDNDAVRRNLRAVLESAGLTVCGEAVDGLDVLNKAAELLPDLIILDVKMPKMSGIEAASILKRRMPDTPLLLLTLYPIGPAVASAAGVKGVLAKPDDIRLLPAYVKNLLEPPPPLNTLIISEA
jgi:CheY-like chemotaxis protein